MTYEELKEALRLDRTVRRFHAEEPVSADTLKKLVDLTRYCASGRNAQPLRYRLVTDENEMNALYPALAWAGYYTEWDGPAPQERPGAYLVQCLDTDFGPNCLCDDGLHLQTITLGALTLGLNCCIIKAFNPELVNSVLNLPSNMQPRYVVAIGKGNEIVKLEDMDGNPSSSFKYYHDEQGVHTVPKRPLSELIIS